VHPAGAGCDADHQDRAAGLVYVHLRCSSGGLARFRRHDDRLVSTPGRGAAGRSYRADLVVPGRRAGAGPRGRASPAGSAGRGRRTPPAQVARAARPDRLPGRCLREPGRHHGRLPGAPALAWVGPGDLPVAGGRHRPAGGRRQAEARLAQIRTRPACPRSNPARHRARRARQDRPAAGRTRAAEHYPADPDRALPGRPGLQRHAARGRDADRGPARVGQVEPAERAARPARPVSRCPDLRDRSEGRPDGRALDPALAGRPRPMAGHRLAGDRSRGSREDAPGPAARGGHARPVVQWRGEDRAVAQGTGDPADLRRGRGDPGHRDRRATRPWLDSPTGW
jgi:hypothetical protein